MISEYIGPRGNSPLIFQHLVGSKIEGVFTFEGGLYFVFERGVALRLLNHAENRHVPDFTVLGAEEAGKIVELRRGELVPLVAEFSAIPPIKEGSP